MPSSTVFNILDACREPGCPICRLEAQSVERYLENQFYENVNSPKWRDGLRASLGFCHEHAWLGVNKRLGDALGYSIIYHDLVNSILKQINDENSSSHGSRRRMPFLKQLPESAREKVEKILDVLTPHKRCPVCEKRDETTRMLIRVWVEEIKSPELLEALHTSEGLCLPHLRMALEHIHDASDCEQLIALQREKLEGLRSELSEFIRKNDYQSIQEGFGKEGDAWLRAIGMVVGRWKMS
jgi:hypothetical protein